MSRDPLARLTKRATVALQALRACEAECPEGDRSELDDLTNRTAVLIERWRGKPTAAQRRGRKAESSAPTQEVSSGDDA